MLRFSYSLVLLSLPGFADATLWCSPDFEGEHGASSTSGVCALAISDEWCIEVDDGFDPLGCDPSEAVMCLQEDGTWALGGCRNEMKVCGDCDCVGSEADRNSFEFCPVDCGAHAVTAPHDPQYDCHVSHVSVPTGTCLSGAAILIGSDLAACTVCDPPAGSGTSGALQWQADLAQCLAFEVEGCFFVQAPDCGGATPEVP